MLRLMLVWLMLAGFAVSHQIEEIPMSVEIDGDRVVATAEADAAYMLPEFRGDEDEEAKDLAWLRGQGPEEWEMIARECEAYWRECLQLKADGRELAWTLSVPGLETDAPDLLQDGDPEELPMLDVRIEAEIPAGTGKLTAYWKESFGVNLIVTIGEGEAAETKPLVGSGEEATLAERHARGADMVPAETSLAGWVRLGFVHILPEGVDHILFVLGLFLLVPKWKPLLQQTVVFTLAHSASLAAAALGWVSFPSTPVEVLIAASIAWVGIENFWAKELGRGRLVLVGILGLVHGLGFAGVLAELLPAGQPEKLPSALFGFNVGVELGQVAVLAIAFAAFSWWGKRFVRVKWTGSALVAAAGLILLAERLTNVDLVPFL